MSTGVPVWVGARRVSRRPAARRSGVTAFRWSGVAAFRLSSVAKLWVILTLVASVSCTGRNQSPQESDASGDPQSLAEWVVGEWQIIAENGTGPQLTISIDSATATTLNGHVMRFISGNTGLGPGEFRPFTGSARQNESIELTIEMVDAQPSTRMQLELYRTAADLEVRGFRLGTQDMTANDRVWIARRLR